MLLLDVILNTCSLQFFSRNLQRRGTGPLETGIATSELACLLWMVEIQRVLQKRKVTTENLYSLHYGLKVHLKHEFTGAGVQLAGDMIPTFWNGGHQ